MKTCQDCSVKQRAPEIVRKCMGEVYYCPRHHVYVRPDEHACKHHEPTKL